MPYSPTTETDIVNCALDEVGEAAIADITSPINERERMCARSYHLMREDLLRQHVWNFAKKRVVVSRSGAALFDFEDSYTLPANFIRLLEVGGVTELERETDYDIEGLELLFDGGGAATQNIRIIENVEDISRWDKSAKLALVYAVALKINYSITRSNQNIERLNGLYAVALKNAISSDGQEVKVKVIDESAATNLRLSAGSNSNVAGRFTTFEG